MNTVCVLSDHQPANHQEFEISVIGETTGRTAVNTENSKEHCAQDITSEFEDARTQRTSKESDTVMFDSQKEHCAQAIITGFDGARTQNVNTDSNTVSFEGQNKHCTQVISSEIEDALTQKFGTELNTLVIKAEIHAENKDGQHMVHFEEELLRCRIFDYTGATVTFYTRHDQRTIDVGVCDTTARIMVPCRLDR